LINQNSLKRMCLGVGLAGDTEGARGSGVKLTKRESLLVMTNKFTIWEEKLPNVVLNNFL